MNSPHETHEEALKLAKGIRSLAYNIWWTWNPRAQELFKALSTEAWVDSGHNALAVLHSLTHDELIATLYSKHIGKQARDVIEEFQGYLNDENTWGHHHCKQMVEHPVAYFSAEFGLHESLPIYSGGLGILSGDHIKSSSDLGVPMVGVTLFYRSGYFQQRLRADGWQEETYPLYDPHDLPIELVTDPSGEPIVGHLKIAHSDVAFHAWKLNVGRNVLYLLDTHRSENDLHWREITGRVYGGDHTTRICQELTLGVGGVRLLRALGIEPSVYHLNEGHSAFLLLELMRDLVEQGDSVQEACKKVRERAVFTTHTPVPAGHDRFSRDLVEHIMHAWPGRLGLSIEEFMNLGRANEGDAHEPMCMTVLALKHTRKANAVSELNGQVSRRMWRHMYPQKKEEEVPIGHITNGVHILGWMNRVTYSFWEHNLGTEWLKHIMQFDFWEKVANPEFLSDEGLWALRYRCKRQMIEAVRDILERQQLRTGAGSPMPRNQVLNPDALTIGFARRFATYKRAWLLFKDPERAARLLNDPRRPIQIIFAGKAHPRDDPGKSVIQHIYQNARDPRFIGKVFFVENYNIQLARYLISGCDVWLNTPRRPQEASGTSGMKTAVHGGLNLSIMDGWWREGYDGTNGFAIGEDRHPDDTEQQDQNDCENLFRALESEVVPEYYDRDEMNIPRKWIKRIRRAMVTLIPRFNTDRMVAEYTKKYYKCPAEE